VVPIALVYAAMSVPAANAEEVTRMELFTSLAVTARSLREREDGQTLGYEAVTLALVIFAILGVVSLVGRVT
jgi:hypothetical protein